MLNTNQPHVPESSTQRNQSANISIAPAPPSPFPTVADHEHLAPSFAPNSAVGDISMGTDNPPVQLENTYQPNGIGIDSDLSPSLCGEGTNTGGSNGTVAAAVEEDDVMNVEGSNASTFEVATITVGCNEDILEKIIPFASQREIFIVGATGTLSYVELLINRQEATVTKTALQGNFNIVSIDGSLSRLTVLVTGDDGRLRGGPVRRLISKSPVQILISTMSRSDIESMARKNYMARNNEPLPLPDRSRITEIVNRAYKDTLKELIQTPADDVPDW